MLDMYSTVQEVDTNGMHAIKFYGTSLGALYRAGNTSAFYQRGL